MNWYKKAQFQQYPQATDVVSGLSVLPDIPNTSSISATLENYYVLPNVREVPMSDFEVTGKSYSVSENKYIGELAEKIKESKEIAPLIVVVDDGGAYILEGSHRIDALYRLGVETFPALVVIEGEDELV